MERPGELGQRLLKMQGGEEASLGLSASIRARGGGEGGHQGAGPAHAAGPRCSVEQAQFHKTSTSGSEDRQVKAKKEALPLMSEPGQKMNIVEATKMTRHPGVPVLAQ